MQDLNDVAAAIDSRRRILDWRDRCCIEAPLELDAAVMRVGDRIDRIIAGADWRDAWFHSDAFFKERIDPIVGPAVGLAVHEILARARNELDVLIDDLAIDIALRPQSRGGNVEGFIDIASGLAPMAGGIALAGATPALAVSTLSAGFLGLATITVVSWPVAIGVGGLAAVGLGLGLHRTAGIKDRQERRLRQLVDTRIALAVFGEGDDERSSLLARLLSTLDASTELALKRIAHAVS